MGDRVGDKVCFHLAGVKLVTSCGGQMRQGLSVQLQLLRNTRIHAHTGSYLNQNKQVNPKMTSTRDDALHPSRAVLRAARGASSSSGEPLRLPGLVLILSGMLLVPVQPSSAHPQCLDFEPPFKPHWHLEFCTQYEQFGCCDQDTDNTIAERYWDIIDQLDVAGYDLCADELKEIMCQVTALYS